MLAAANSNAVIPSEARNLSAAASVRSNERSVPTIMLRIVPLALAHHSAKSFAPKSTAQRLGVPNSLR
jgi:hypothetical protein